MTIAAPMPKAILPCVSILGISRQCKTIEINGINLSAALNPKYEKSRNLAKVAVKVIARKTEAKLLLPKVKIGNAGDSRYGNNNTRKSLPKYSSQA